jgi:dTDP-4-dehydrorhamnose reductase
MNNAKKILVTGANGLLGQKIADIFRRESEHELTLSDLQEKAEDSRGYKYIRLDITNKEEIKNAVRQYVPDVIINTAAYTNVDGCETERELSWRINVDGVKNLIIASRINDSRLVHISTDYVFDGKTGYYDENSKPNPKSFYGKGKLAAENALISSGLKYAIVRTMILYGTGKNLRPNFALWLIDSLGKNIPVNIVIDQYGQPTMIDDLALALLRIVDKNREGIYHVCGSEYLSRFEFASKLADVFALDKRLIVPIRTPELSQPAERPMNSSFITLKAETELGIKPLNVTEGLYLLKHQLGHKEKEV